MKDYGLAAKDLQERFVDRAYKRHLRQKVYTKVNTISRDSLLIDSSPAHKRKKKQKLSFITDHLSI